MERASLTVVDDKGTEELCRWARRVHLRMLCGLKKREEKDDRGIAMFEKNRGRDREVALEKLGLPTGSFKAVPSNQNLWAFSATHAEVDKAPAILTAMNQVHSQWGRVGREHGALCDGHPHR